MIRLSVQLWGGMLENQGIEVSFATDGNSAIYAAVNDRPDLIFLDLIMPQIDGFEVITQLRKMRNTRRIPVVLVTGRTDATTLVESDEGWRQRFHLQAVHQNGSASQIEVCSAQ